MEFIVSILLVVQESRAETKPSYSFWNPKFIFFWTNFCVFCMLLQMFFLK